VSSCARAWWRSYNCPRFPPFAIRAHKVAVAPRHRLIKKSDRGSALPQDICKSCYSFEEFRRRLYTDAGLGPGWRNSPEIFQSGPLYLGEWGQAVSANYGSVVVAATLRTPIMEGRSSSNLANLSAGPANAL
jgi:hypothetical protein